MSTPSAFYIPERQGSNAEVDKQLRALALEVSGLKNISFADEQKLKELEDKLQKHGVNFYDGLKTYAKDDLILFGDMAQQAFFYKSLQDDNIGHLPSLAESSSWWMMIAGDYISQLFGDVTGDTTGNVVEKVGGALATDIAAVTNAIKSGNLDHPESLTIGETTPIVNIGTGANPKTINLGGAGDTVAVAGNLVTVHTDNLQVKDSLLRLNREGLAGSAADAGIEIEEAGAVAAYIKTNGSRNGFVLKAPASSEIALNQSVATSSSPSFQMLTTTGSGAIVAGGNVHSGGCLRVQSQSNPVGVGSYMAHGSTSMPGASIFMNQPGSGIDGGWRWIMYGSNNAWLADAMSLTRSGNLSVNGGVTSSGMRTTSGISIGGWNSTALQTNDAFIGRNRTFGTGMMSFACNRGVGVGGFEWVSYDQAGTLESIPMTLTRHGDLTLARNATVNGDLTVTGNITGLNLVQSTQTVTGSWNGGVSAMAANIKAMRFGPMVTLTFSGFSGPLPVPPCY